MRIFKTISASEKAPICGSKLEPAYILARTNGREKSRFNHNIKSKNVTLQVPSSYIKKCQAEQFAEKIEGKSRFFGNETMIKINQHTTKCVFDDFSYIMFKSDDFTVYDKHGQVVSYGKHLNKDVLNAKGKK